MVIETCHCGADHCMVPTIASAMDEYVTNGGDLEHARILWCTHPGCRAFEVVDDLTHRFAYVDALCPDHRGVS